MPFESLRNPLYDIRDNILLAHEFVAGLDYSAFSSPHPPETGRFFPAA
jgi:hypothetical protein